MLIKTAIVIGLISCFCDARQQKSQKSQPNGNASVPASARGNGPASAPSVKSSVPAPPGRRSPGGHHGKPSHGKHSPYKPPKQPVIVRPTAQTIYAGKVFMLPGEKFTVLQKSDVVFMDSKATVWRRETAVVQRDGSYFYGNETFVDCLAIALDGPNSKCEGFVPLASNSVRAPRQALFYRLGLALRNVSPNDNGIYIGGVLNKNNSFVRIPGSMFKLNVRYA